MAYWAEVNDENVVVRVAVMDNNHRDGNEGGTWLVENLGGRWIQTSFNNNFRGVFANEGFLYDEELDVFLPPTPLNLGFIDFRGKRFYLGKGAYVPNLDDSDQQRMLDEIGDGAVVADIGAGIGVAGLSVALEHSGSDVHLVELYDEPFRWMIHNLDLFKEEVEQNKSSISTYNISVEDSADVLPLCDYIIADLPVFDDSQMFFDNPAIPREAAYGGDDGLQVIQHLPSVAESCLKVGGVMWLTAPHGDYTKCIQLFDEDVFAVEPYGLYAKVTRLK